MKLLPENYPPFLSFRREMTVNVEYVNARLNSIDTVMGKLQVPVNTNVILNRQSWIGNLDAATTTRKRRVSPEVWIGAQMSLLTRRLDS